MRIAVTRGGSTMKKLCALFAVAVLGFCFVAAQAEDKKAEDKEVTLKGKLKCGKCTLKDKECKVCTNVLEVEKDGKTTQYFLDDKGNKEAYHKGICPPGKSADATVVGVVSKKEDKMWIKPSKVE